ncbi:MAG: cupin domain-containing protein [Deltaproteobacteria bacterium]|nr:cupin domain-containing protein [Deltaproteobacteria bacterium]
MRITQPANPRPFVPRAGSRSQPRPRRAESSAFVPPPRAPTHRQLPAPANAASVRSVPIHAGEFIPPTPKSEPLGASARDLVENEFKLAPDQSQIRELSTGVRGSFCHCRLPAGRVTQPVQHRSIEEIWFCSGGRGELWMKRGDEEVVVPLDSGRSVTIPPKTSFQFRSLGEEPLEIMIATMPPWPGPQEAMPTKGHWTPS